MISVRSLLKEPIDTYHLWATRLKIRIALDEKRNRVVQANYVEEGSSEGAYETSYIYVYLVGIRMGRYGESRRTVGACAAELSFILRV